MCPSQICLVADSPRPLGTNCPWTPTYVHITPIAIGRERVVVDQKVDDGLCRSRCTPRGAAAFQMVTFRLDFSRNCWRQRKRGQSGTSLNREVARVLWS